MSDDAATTDLYSQAQPTSATRSGFTRHVESKATFGKGAPHVDHRKFKYDVIEARRDTRQMVSWHVTKDDRMSVEEASRKLHQIHEKFGIAGENPAALHEFDMALFFAHTLNSGSTIQPGRAKLYVHGSEFDLVHVNIILGVDLRRFYRAFADDITRANRMVLDDYDPYDPVKVERHQMLVAVALERGLQKYPEFAHDSSDACLHMTPVERMAVSQSKRFVLNNVQNAADRIHANSRGATADGFNSTLGTVVTSSGRDAQ